MAGNASSNIGARVVGRPTGMVAFPARLLLGHRYQAEGVMTSWMGVQGQLPENHPDPVFRQYILKDIWNGFHIGFDRGVLCTPASSNMCSALYNVSVVQEYLDKVVTLGCIVRSVSPEMVPVGTQLSPFGVIPKSNQPGKWRLIVDLSGRGSSPTGRRHTGRNCSAPSAGGSSPSNVVGGRG